VKAGESAVSEPAITFDSGVLAKNLVPKVGFVPEDRGATRRGSSA
jgi:hypothetical protein